MMGRPARGGLIRGVARTAVVAGTASAVAGGVQHRQQQRWARQEAEQEMLAQHQAGTAPQQQYAPPQQQYAPPQQQYAAPPQQAYEPPPPQADFESPTVKQLERLAALYGSGALSDEEFASAKQRVLSGG